MVSNIDVHITLGVMLTNLLIAVAFIVISSGGIIWLAYRAVRSKSQPHRVWLLLGACAVAAPYAYTQIRMLYRNDLCDKLTGANFPSRSDTWQSEPLNTQFTLQSQSEDHGFGVFHVHRRVTDGASNRVVAQTLAFYSPSSLVDELYPVRVEPVGCPQADSSFEKVVTQIRSEASAQ